MYALVQLAMRGRLHAVLVAAGFAWAAVAMMHVPGAAVVLLLPMAVLMYASAAIVGLTTLRSGTTEAGFVILVGGLVLSGCILLSQLPLRHVLEVVFSAWVPALIAALVLGRTSDQGIAAGAIAATATVIAVMVLLISGDPAVELEAWLTDHWAEMSQVIRQSIPNAPSVQMSITPADVARSATHMMLSSWVFGVLLSLLLARWWHARMDRPGGFGKEFKAFRLPRWLALATIAVTALSALLDGGMRTLTGALSQVGLLLFMVQGVAVVHGIVAIRAAHRGWLAAMYILLFVLMPMSLFAIALTGFFDHWLDYRKRAQR